MKNLYIRTKNFIFKNKITKILGLILLIALAFLIFKIISGKLSGKDGEIISSNQVVTLKKGSVTNSVTEKGRVVPSNSVEVFAEKPLPVTHVNVKVGDLVKKGDVIAQLDSSSIEQQLKSRRAQKSATDKNLSAQISAAKKRLDEAISGRDSGKNPAIVAAETSLTQAMDQYLAAQKSYDDFKRSLDEAYNQGMVAEKSTRENLAYQEEATDLKYRQLQDDMNKNANKIVDNRALAADKARQEAYLQNALDNEKRRLTELGISIKEEQGRLAEAQEKVTSLQSENIGLNAEIQEEEAKGADKDQSKIDSNKAKILQNKKDIEAINFEEIKKSANENINKLTRTQNEVEIEVNRISEDLATAKADQQKYTSEAEAMEKELEGQGKQVDAARLEVKKAKEDLASDAEKAIKSQKSRDDELKTLAQNLETARDNYESAKRNLESTKTQVANEISGLSDNLKTAKASANNLDRVEIENLTEELEKSLIKAPSDGTVTEVNAKEGQAPAAAVAKIETIDTLRIESQVKEYDKNSVAVGTLVEITSDSALGETYKGRVISIDPVPMAASADNKTGEVLYKTTIELDEGQETKLSPGMTLRVKYIMSEEKNTFKVPTDAVFERDGKNYILALKDMGKDKYQIQKLEVSLGLSNDAETAIKSKDLKENDKVLATSGGYGEGSLVKVVDADLTDKKAGEKDEK